MNFNRGVGIAHFNRLEHLPEVVEAVCNTVPPNTRVVIADDGSDPLNGVTVESVAREFGVILIKGPNLGVAANKNRVLWGLQDCQFLCILEDDLKPVQKGWFEQYETAAVASGIHHFCRVQTRQCMEVITSFSAYMGKHNLSPIYGPHPRGDLGFITSTVLHRVGAFNPKFRGAGHAHGEWSNRVWKAGLIGHPNKWIDIEQARDKFIQIGDREGGRWKLSEDELKRQMNRNKQVLKELNRSGYVHHPLVLE